MSDSDSAAGGPIDNQMRFVRIIQDFPVVLYKSQLPKVKERKAEAIRHVLEKFNSQTGNSFNERQITKKINNMKNDVKSKSDVMKTGNKPIYLKDWEKLLLKLLDAEKNPTFSCVKGKCYDFYKYSRNSQLYIRVRSGIACIANSMFISLLKNASVCHFVYIINDHLVGSHPTLLSIDNPGSGMGWRVKVKCCL